MTETTTVTDARGRKISFVALDVLDQYRIARILGRSGHPEDAQNQVVLQMATVAWAVTEIDGVPVSRPATDRQIEARVGELGNDGFAAVMLAMREQIDATESAAAQAAERDLAKNSPTTPTS